MRSCVQKREKVITGSFQKSRFRHTRRWSRRLREMWVQELSITCCWSKTTRVFTEVRHPKELKSCAFHRIRQNYSLLNDYGS